MSRQPLSKLLAAPFSHFCVGSLPFTDSALAVQYVFEHPWIVPFWPELPNRSKSELMLSRAERTLDPLWDGHNSDEVSCLFVLKEQVLRQNTSLAVLKCQLMGPLSFIFFSRFLEGTFSDRLQLAVEVCLKQIEWQRNYLRELGSPLIFVLDEPGLQHWDELSELEQSAIKDAYSYIYVRVSEVGEYLGLHSCAAFAPDMLEFPVELLSFDIWCYGGTAFSSDAWRLPWIQALDRGILPVPGVFPAIGGSDMVALKNQGHAHYRAFDQFLRGINRPVPNLLFSANCGHAFADPAWLRMLYDPDVS